MTLDAHLGVEVGSFTLDLPLAAADGKVLAILGPNGAGKSTALALLAGHRRLGHGRLELDGRVLDDPEAGVFVAPADRQVGMVPQDLLLFPHLSVLDNVAFGIRAAGRRSKAAARAEAADLLQRLGLDEFAARRPSELSGGQAQRIALARALAVDPRLLLLDEPLAALDVTARDEVRRDLRRRLDDFSGVAVVVTHDPLDALLLADRVVVVEDGTATQEGPMVELTARPRTPYVAALAGTNLLVGEGKGRTVDVGPGTIEVAEPVHGPVFATVAPRAVALHAVRPETSARNVWPVTVASIDLIGERVRLGLAGAPSLVAEITARSFAESGLRLGDEAWASVKSTEIDLYGR